MIALWELGFRGVRVDNGQPIMVMGMSLTPKNTLNVIVVEQDGTFSRYLASEVIVDWRYNVETDTWDDLNLRRRSESGLDRYEQG